MKTMMRPVRLLMLAPLAFALGACESDPATPDMPDTVVALAIDANEDTGEFSTLIAALTEADLVGTLQGSGPFTVFAPTDAAFAAINLNASNIGTLPVETLEDILLYHVAPGRLDAANVTSRTSIAMANGGTTSISVSGGVARIDDARIVQTNLMADNGVVHVIDAVIMP